MAPRRLLLTALCAAQLSLAASVQPNGGTPLPSPLPRLRIAPGLTIHGLSSGADAAVLFSVAYSSITIGAGIFAGQAYAACCTRFANENLTTCAAAPTGPGCAGMPDHAPCSGCGPSPNTVQYDHSKKVAVVLNEPSIVASTMLSLVAARSSSGTIDPVSHMSTARYYTFRGKSDTVYLAGCVNATAALYSSLTATPEQVVFVSDVDSAHAIPSLDPVVTTACNGSHAAWPAGFTSCGYDGPGAMLTHIFKGGMTPPTNYTADPDNLFPFAQAGYVSTDGRAGLSFGSTGYLYIPPACAAGGSAVCRLHIGLHGCGQSAYSPGVGTSFALHSGMNAWAAANNIVVLYPQMGGYLEAGVTAPTVEMGGGCYDGYGQVGADFAERTGPQLSALRAMVEAVAGW